MSFDQHQARDANGRWASSADAGGGTKRPHNFITGKKAHNVKEAMSLISELGFKASEYAKPGSASAAVYSNGTIHINSSHKIWKDPVAGMKVAANLSSQDPAHVIHHEIGHAMYSPPDNFMTMSHQDLARSQVSKYAAMNPKEFVSEVHAGMEAGKQFPESVMQVFATYARKRTSP